jgi:hypothetical protein
MTALAKLTQLRDILQDMYPTIGRAQLIVDTAGLPRNRIAWSAAAQENWHAILSEAHHQRMVPALVDVAKVDFPKRAADLDHALAVYEEALAGAASSRHIVTQPAMSPPDEADQKPAFAGQPGANTAALREILVTYFSKSELRTICFDLGIDHETFSDGGKEEFVVELLKHTQRTGRTAELVARARRDRANVDWSKVG